LEFYHLSSCITTYICCS